MPDNSGYVVCRVIPIYEVAIMKKSTNKDEEDEEEDEDITNERGEMK
jgi:hypothetical protein